RLGHHAFRGQLWEKAVHYLRWAAQRDRARSANRQSAISFEQALAALAPLPTSRELQELSVDIRLEVRNVLLPLGDIAPMLGHLREAEALAIALDDRRRL